MINKRKLSASQLGVLSVLEQMSMQGDAWPARDIARKVGRTTDGTVTTLLSLVRRELAETAPYERDASGYRITEAGRGVVREVRRREAAERQRIQDLLREIREQETT